MELDLENIFKQHSKWLHCVSSWRWLTNANSKLPKTWIHLWTEPASKFWNNTIIYAWWRRVTHIVLFCASSQTYLINFCLPPFPLVVCSHKLQFSIIFTSCACTVACIVRQSYVIYYWDVTEIGIQSCLHTM